MYIYIYICTHLYYACAFVSFSVCVCVYLYTYVYTLTYLGIHVAFRGFCVSKKTCWTSWQPFLTSILYGGAAGNVCFIYIHT